MEPNEELEGENLAVSEVSLVSQNRLNGIFCALRELGPRLTRFKSPKCGSRELEILTNSQLISRALEIVTLFSTHYFALPRLEPSHFSGLCWGNVRFSGRKSFQCEHGINGRGLKRKERHSETTCMEAAGGARSGVKELLCAT